MTHVRSELLSPGVLACTLDRPDRRNALTPDMLEALNAAIRAAGDKHRAVLVRGAGTAFCAGFDLALCRDDPESTALRQLLTSLSNTIQSMRACTAPVVLCAHGAAIAGGCALLGGADLVVADRDAKLGYPVLPLGISPAISAPFLAEAVGHGGARRRLLHPRLMRGDEAHRIGLVHELAETPESAIAAAERLAADLAAKPIGGIRATKRLLNELSTDRGPDALAASLTLVGGDEERRMLPAAWTR